MDEYEDFVPKEDGRVLTEEDVIDEFLGENPRARELRLMRAALEQRREAFLHDRERAKDDRERTALNGKIAELDRQIEVLHREEEITGFVETSVRVSLHRPPDEE
jgi:hypothetical protein